MDNLTFPTVHLNGTSRAELQTQLRDAWGALDKAQDALRKATPHGRDYYPQGDTAIVAALRQHAARCERIADVQAEIMAIWESLV